VELQAYFIALNWWEFRKFIGDFKTLKHILFCFIPWIWMVLVFLILNSIMPHSFFYLENIKDTIIMSLMLVVLMAPIIFLGIRYLGKNKLNISEEKCDIYI
jgi:hypothetical protein